MKVALMPARGNTYFALPLLQREKLGANPKYRRSILGQPM